MNSSFFRSFRRGGLWLALLAQTACVPLQTLQPRAAHEVQVQLPAQWSVAAGEPAGAAVQQQWWRQFADPQLDSLIERSLQSAHDLRLVRARLQQARAALDLAEAGLWPSLGVSAGATRGRSGYASPQTQYAAGFDASWEPSIFGGQRDGVSAAEFDLAASEATLGNAQVSLAAEVALNYVSLRNLQQRLQIARSNLAAQEDTWQLVSWRKQAGLDSELELEQATANLANTRAGIPGLQASLAAAMHRLAVLTGQPPASLQADLAPARAQPGWRWRLSWRGWISGALTPGRVCVCRVRWLGVRRQPVLWAAARMSPLRWRPTLPPPCSMAAASAPALPPRMPARNRPWSIMKKPF